MNQQGAVAPPKKLSQILRRTDELGFDMACEERTGALLRALAAAKPGGRFLEIGTGTGVGTAWLLDGMDEASSLTTVDVSSEYQAVAREAFRDDKRVTFITEDAAEFLGREQPHSYVLVFADALPGKFTHLNLALALVQKDGIFFLDDLLPQPNWPPDHAPKVAVLLSQLSKPKDFYSVSLEWSSGILILTRFR